MSRFIREEAVRLAASQLPPRQRAALALHKFEQMGVREIAEVLDCSEAAAKTLLLHAYATLRAHWELHGKL